MGGEVGECDAWLVLPKQLLWLPDLDMLPFKNGESPAGIGHFRRKLDRVSSRIYNFQRSPPTARILYPEPGRRNLPADS